MQRGLILKELASLASRKANYQSIHLLGSQAVVDVAKNILIDTRSLWSIAKVIITEREPISLDSSQVHLVSKAYLAQAKADYPDHLFITTDDIQTQDGAMNIFSYPVLFALLERVGVIGFSEKDFSTKDARFQAARSRFERITGSKVSDQDFLDYIQGKLEVAQRLAILSPLRAIPLNTAIRLVALGARMVSQAA